MSATMIIGNRGLIEDLQGFEKIQRGARVVVAEGINAEIDRQQQRWEQADLQFEAAGYDVGVRAAGLEHIAVENVFGSPHKSLVASPLSRFPNVAMTAYATRPSAQDALNDRMDVPEITLLVELMVKAGPVVPGQELLIASIIDRRILRTSEALLATIAKSKNLYNTVDRVTQPRGGIVNASWTRNQDTEGEAGATYMLHGSRFTYALITRVSRNY